ncbi:hypothetical protein GGI42DRAFT_26484 [Trichoderma sp. SZMC 28013]
MNRVFRYVQPVGYGCIRRAILDELTKKRLGKTSDLSRWMNRVFRYMQPVGYGCIRRAILDELTKKRLGKTFEPFSLDEPGIPVCATCWDSLRNIARYGRIVRRAILDESTKEFIAWAQYLSLATRLLEGVFN